VLNTFQVRKFLSRPNSPRLFEPGYSNSGNNQFFLTGKTGATNSSSTANILTSYTCIIIRRVYCGTATLSLLGHSLNPSYYLTFNRPNTVVFPRCRPDVVYLFGMQIPGGLVGIASGLRLDNRWIGYRLLAGLKKSYITQSVQTFCGTHTFWRELEAVLPGTRRLGPKTFYLPAFIAETKDARSFNSTFHPSLRVWWSVLQWGFLSLALFTADAQ